MDVKVLCPTLSVMLQKTIVALCEVNIRFKNKLEISGSLHIRADGEKVLNFLIDEECLKGQRHSKEGVARGVLVEPFQKRRHASDAFNLATDALHGMRSPNSTPGGLSNETITSPPVSDAQNLLDLASSAAAASERLNHHHHKSQPDYMSMDSVDSVFESAPPHSGHMMDSQLQGYSTNGGDGDMGMGDESQPPDITQDTGMQEKSGDIVEIPPDLELSCGNAMPPETVKQDEMEKSDNYKEILEQVLSHAMTQRPRPDDHVQGSPPLQQLPPPPPPPLSLAPKRSDSQAPVRLTGMVLPTKIQEPVSTVMSDEMMHAPSSTSMAPTMPGPMMNSSCDTSISGGVKSEPTDPKSPDGAPPQGNGAAGGGTGGQGIPPFAAAFHRHMSRNLLEMHMGAMSRMAQSLDTSMEDACTMGKMGKKKWQCVLCGLMLSSKFYLKSHINAVHTRSRIFPCEICGKLFYSHGAQRIHKLRNHWVEKRHKCQFCGQLFVLPFELRQHIQKKHDNQQATPPSHQQATPSPTT